VLHLLSDVCGSETESCLALFSRPRPNAILGRAAADTANATGARAKRRMKRLRDRSGDNKFDIQVGKRI
jgi:hypothetical protein